MKREWIPKEEFIHVKSIKAYTRVAFCRHKNDFSYVLKIQPDGSAVIKIYSIGFIRRREYHITKSQLSLLASKLYESSFLNWKYHDYEPFVCDGHGWAIKVKLQSGRTITKKGANRKPDDYGVVCNILGMWDHPKNSITFDELHEIGRMDRIKGCLIGGAAGDALGYPIEFMRETEIKENYGEFGIEKYAYDPKTKKALISDDTQMSMFTANGLLVAAANDEKNIAACVARSYEDWLATQVRTFEDMHEPERRDPNSEFYHVDNSWLLDVPEMYANRAPGSTCIYSMIERVKHGPEDSYLDQPINESKGCGGVMRVAPVGMYSSKKDAKTIAMEAAEIAAITHSHPLGYIPAAMLADIIYRITNDRDARYLLDTIKSALYDVNELFEGESCLNDFNEIICLAVRLSKNDDKDIDNIHKIGEGWVAEETLAIAIYCSLRYTHNFTDGIVAAVNHNGDSDSTGAVTGNILGAYNGFEEIDNQWKHNLEHYNVLKELANDLYNAERIKKDDTEWNRKYRHP